MSPMLDNKSILLIISGGIAAYKSCALIRLLKKSGAHVRCILTHGGSQFITPMSVAALSEEKVYTDLWDLKDESEMGHIRLSREADLIVVAPASANMIAQMAYGLAEDLASTTLLAADKPIMIAPAMNPMMWGHAATQDNLETLRGRGVEILMPNDGDMACGEIGTGRMREPEEIFEAVCERLLDQRLKGVKALLTAGPTYEAIDPVRFLGNRSSGKQGYAMAEALRDAGAEVTLVSGPTALKDPEGMHVIRVESAAEMLEASENALPCDIAICAAAVSDWAPLELADHKMKKREDGAPPTIKLKENPDILSTIANHAQRPALVIGFAAETQNLDENARAKLSRKRCDWIVGNLSTPSEKIFGESENRVTLYTSQEKQEDWPKCSKQEVAQRLVSNIVEYMKNHGRKRPQAAE